MRTQLYDLLNEFNNVFYEGESRGFPLDVIKEKDGYEVVAELAGFSKEDIKIEFEDGVLTINALRKENKENEKKYLLKEIKQTKFTRKLNFGDIEEDDIIAKYENGLLLIKITVKAPVEKAKKMITLE